MIIRTKSGSFKIDDAITLKELEQSKNTISIDDNFEDFKKIEIFDSVIIKKILNGVRLSKQELGINEEGKFFIKIENQLIGMYHFDGQKLICDVFLG